MRLPYLALLALFCFSAACRQAREETVQEPAQVPRPSQWVEITKLEFTEDRQAIDVVVEGNLSSQENLSMSINFSVKNQRGELEIAGWDPIDEESDDLKIEREVEELEHGAFRETQRLVKLPIFSVLEVSVSCNGETKARTLVNPDGP